MDCANKKAPPGDETGGATIHAIDDAGRKVSTDMLDSTVAVAKDTPAFTLFESVNQTTAKDVLTLEDLAKWARNPTVGAKESAACIAPHNGTGKTKAAIEHANFAAIVIDHDDGDYDRERIIEAYKGIAHVAFTTSSHTAKHPRWKVVLPLAKTLEADAWSVLAEGAAQCMAADTSQARPTQVFYAPNKIEADAAYDHLIDLQAPCLNEDEGLGAKFVAARRGESGTRRAPIAERAAGRNDYLTRLGGQMRFRGADDDAITAELNRVNAAADPKVCKHFETGPLDAIEVQRIIRSVLRYESGIQLEEGKEAEGADSLERALITAEASIYQRGGALVRPGLPSSDNAINRPEAEAVFTAVNQTTLLDLASRHAMFVKYDGRVGGYRKVRCPNLIAGILENRRGFWRFPEARGVVRAPTIRMDGSIAYGPGYDARTRLLLRHNLKCDIPSEPSKRDAEAALDAIKKPFAEFPFSDDASRSVALAAVLTALVRPVLPTAPMFLIDSPLAASGKGLLVDVCSLIAAGHEVPVTGQGEKDDEFEKRLDSILIAGDTVTSIDNIDRPLRSDKLCMALTQSAVRIRDLGRSRVIDCPTTITFFGTGNNIQVVGDLNRRVVVCEIDPMVERPEDRTFETSDLRNWVREHRQELVTAALTILRAHAIAGRPFDGRPSGSFETWSRWIRGALTWLGQPDPIETQDKVREEDPERAQLLELLQAWRARYGTRRMSAGEVIDDAEGDPEMERLVQDVASGARGKVSAHALQRWLKRHKNRPIDGLKLKFSEEYGKPRYWVKARADQRDRLAEGDLTATSAI